MTVEWNGDQVMRDLRTGAAKSLMAVALFFENTLKQKVSTPSPFITVKRTRNTIAGAKGSTYRVYYDPSKPGEYPKLRTGAGQKAATHRPMTIADVIQAGFAVRVGYVEGDHHLLALEFGMGRKGLIDLLDELRPQLSALVAAEFRNER